MARAARGVFPSESVVLISISSRKMSRAGWLSAGVRRDCAAAGPRTATAATRSAHSRTRGGFI